jgi:DNA polymerase III alpha subunit (gram-positive type)
MYIYIYLNSGTSMWKQEQERMTKFCNKNQIKVKDCYIEVMKSLKLGQPKKTTGQGGLTAVRVSFLVVHCILFFSFFFFFSVAQYDCSLLPYTHT